MMLNMHSALQSSAIMVSYRILFIIMLDEVVLIAECPGAGVHN
jgi:hypothetical protein